MNGIFDEGPRSEPAALRKGPLGVLPQVLGAGQVEGDEEGLAALPGAHGSDGECVAVRLSGQRAQRGRPLRACGRGSSQL